jgi:hypothetical protein
VELLNDDGTPIGQRRLASRFKLSWPCSALVVFIRVLYNPCIPYVMLCDPMIVCTSAEVVSGW